MTPPLSEDLRFIATFLLHTGLRLRELFALDGSMLGEGLNQNGEGMKRLTLSAPDLSACYRALIDRKVEARLENDRIVIGSPFLGGARLEIVSRQGF